MDRGFAGATMEGVTFKARAIAFAFCIGATAFILAMLAGADGTPEAGTVTRAIVVALICGIMAWAAAEHSLAGLATAIDSASTRIVAAAQGDLATPTPGVVHEQLPELGYALDSMFDQVRASLDTAHRLAMFDPVTSLANRMHFRREADRALGGLGPQGKAALAFIDLDHFKVVNDTLGHAQGDQLLAKLANRLRTLVAAETARVGASGEEAIVGRLAGDEFTILFPGADATDSARLGDALLAELNKPFDLFGQHLTVSASIGFALRPDHGNSLTALMRAADVAMYQAKANGRARYEFFADAMSDRFDERNQLEVELRGALDKDEFMMVFQPQVSLADCSVVAVEGLLRWSHPVDGLRRPATFLDCAEESGLIVDIGDRSVEALAARVASWPRNALAPRIAVNLSPRQIARADFFTHLRAAMGRHRASFQFVEFEISEGIAMTCGDSVLDQMAQLRDDGATITIDDFGAGFSSIARLRALPVDALKLDPSLIAGIETDASIREIAQAVIGLAHGLGVRAIAEGVENDAQIDVLRVMGCDAVQGYAIAPPMIEADYLRWRRRDAGAAQRIARRSTPA